MRKHVYAIFHKMTRFLAAFQHLFLFPYLLLSVDTYVLLFLPMVQCEYLWVEMTTKWKKVTVAMMQKLQTLFRIDVEKSVTKVDNYFFIRMVSVSIFYWGWSWGDWGEVKDDHLTGMISLLNDINTNSYKLLNYNSTNVFNENLKI